MLDFFAGFISRFLDKCVDYCLVTTGERDCFGRGGGLDKRVLVFVILQT